MTTKQNLHTHCTYCDGDSTIREIVEAALQVGFTAIGFSSHACTRYPFDECGIKEDQVDAYFAELEKVKAEYEGKIHIFKGMELESRVLGEERPTIDPRCDYTIGSCHFFRKDNAYYEVDYLPEIWLKAKAAYGSTEALLESYFEELASFAEESSFDILGHFDLPTKFNDKDHLFAEEDPHYQKMAMHYLERIVKTGKIFEVNTGAISRKRKTLPYPAAFLLQKLLELKAPITISSDSHHKDTLTCYFEESEKLLKEMGFKEQMALTEKGFVAVPL